MDGPALPDEWPDWADADTTWDWGGPDGEAPGTTYVRHANGDVDARTAEDYRPPDETGH